MLMTVAPFSAWITPDLSPSPGMRIGFIALGLLFILLSALDGRREGLGRKSFGVIALIGGICVGYFGADFWGVLAGKFLPTRLPRCASSAASAALFFSASFSA